MRSVSEHYEQHLGGIYSWMAGGIEAAVARGRAEIDALRLDPTRTASAVDLGAGFGMHAIPLAQQGFSVLAVDSSRILLRQLSTHAGALAIRTVAADLLTFRRYLADRPNVVLCMGDTLPHLESLEAIEALLSEIAAALTDDGILVLTFRDYSAALVGEGRFIPVRADSDRILTCFLEFGAEDLTVHDLLHEREHMQWRLRVSSYRKLRIKPDWTCRTLEQNGFCFEQEPGYAGMMRWVCRRRSKVVGRP